jgi:hypothetical protein
VPCALGFRGNAGLLLLLPLPGIHSKSTTTSAEETLILILPTLNRSVWNRTTRFPGSKLTISKGSNGEIVRDSRSFRSGESLWQDATALEMALSFVLQRAIGMGHIALR